MQNGLGFIKFLWLFAFTLSSFSCTDDSNQLIELSGNTMGTTYHIKYRNEQIDLSSEYVQTEIDELLEDINQTMSTYITDSELMHFNHYQGSDCFAISDELFYVINTAVNISEMTDGAFDITIGPVVNLWGFGPQAMPVQIPEPELLRTTLSKTGYLKLRLNEQNQCITKLDNKLWLDLSAIAKGYAVDQVSTILKKNNLENFMIEIGGEIYTHGNKTPGQVWRIGVEKPSINSRTVHKIISLMNQGMATSGDYRNYYESNNQRYSHIIDPKTGKPVAHKLASVSVLHSSTMTADALATAFLVLGLERSQPLIEKEKLAVYMIIRENENFIDWASPAFTEHTIH